MRNYYKRKINLNKISEEELLGLKISDLPVSINNSKFIMSLIKKVTKELKRKKINIKIHFYLSDEWFCVNNTQSIGIPFFLAHPRLLSLEKKIMGYAEGEKIDYALKLLRHEIGHVIDNSFSLKHDKERIRIFGKASLKYPSSYSFQPYSKAFVKNIELGYAQSHPTEDFAETFAVWLEGGLKWKEKYNKGSAIKKLEYIDFLMKNLSFYRAKPIYIEQYYSKNEIDITLEKYYKFKMKRFFIAGNSFWDHFLFNFIDQRGGKKRALSRILRKNKKVLENRISKKLKVYKYQASNAINSIIYRSERLNLYSNRKKFKLKLVEKQLVNNVKKYFLKDLQKVVF